MCHVRIKIIGFSNVIAARISYMQNGRAKTPFERKRTKAPLVSMPWRCADENSTRQARRIDTTQHTIPSLVKSSARLSYQTLTSEGRVAAVAARRV